MMSLTPSFVLALLASTSLVCAAPPGEKPAGRRGLSIPLSRNGGLLSSAPTLNVTSEAISSEINRVKNRYAATLKAYKAAGHTALLPNGGSGKRDASVAEREMLDKLPVLKRSTGSVTLADKLNQSLWTGSMSVGTPAQTFTLDFDTGSSNLYIDGSKYQPTKSSSAVKSNANFSISYGDGSTASGPVYFDTIEVGGLMGKNTSVGDATTESSTLDGVADGIAGMAYPSISTINAPPFFNNLCNEGVVDSCKFGFRLARDGNAAMDLGFINGKYGSLTYTPVTDQAYWTVSGTPVAKGTSQPAISAIIDTGTTVVLAPPISAVETCLALGFTPYTQVSTSPEILCLFPCDADPGFSFNFGGKEFPISNTAFNLGSADQVLLGNLFGSNQCVSGLFGAEVGVGANSWIVGDVFLQNVYAGFDFTQNRVGFVAATD